ncbi:MAG: hypothetical protein STSR0008_05140 [Ignavibacterium sp.]
MYYKKLFQIIDRITSRIFSSEIEMLISVVNELVVSEDIDVIGGRIWELDLERKGYVLIYQTGKIEKIEKEFFISIKDYPIFDLLAKERTFLANETNVTLRKKGIFEYTATGVGNKIKIDGKQYYEFLLAFNVNNLTNEFKYSLGIIAAVLTSKLKQWRTSLDHKIMKVDLNKAQELQRSILPQHEYSFQSYDLYGVTLPAEVVGGDFFDYLEIGSDDDRIGIALGDAASKGVAAAAEAMYISGALRMATTFEIKISPLMKRMNKLVNKIFSGDKFSSLFYGELSTDQTGLFLYANAGHNPPIFLKRKSKRVKYLLPTGPILGPAPESTYNVENINFEKGDVLLIYSDGIIESSDENGNGYGEERLFKVLNESKHLTPKEIALLILESVNKFSANGKYSDDKTVVVIKKTK